MSSICLYKGYAKAYKYYYLYSLADHLSHPSKIEASHVNIKLGSFFELAKGLDYEVMLIPRQDVLLYGEHIGSMVLLTRDQTLFTFHPSYSEKLNLLPEGHMQDYLARLADVKPSMEYWHLGEIYQELLLS